MSAISDFFSQFAEQLGRLWPFAIIEPWEQGVRLFAGKITGLLTHENGIRKSGLHWHWPLIGSIYALESNVEVFETEPQSIRTVDEAEVTFTLGLQCRIDRLDLFYANVSDDMQTTVADAVRSVAGETAMARYSGELNTEWCKTVRDLAAARMAGWGVRLLRVSLVTCTRSPVLRLIGANGVTHNTF